MHALKWFASKHKNVYINRISAFYPVPWIIYSLLARFIEYYKVISDDLKFIIFFVSIFAFNQQKSLVGGTISDTFVFELPKSQDAQSLCKY